LEGAPGAKLEVGPVRLIGRSLSGDRKEWLEYPKGTPGIAPEIVHEAISGAMVWPPQLPQGQPTPAPARVTRGFIVAVREGAPFSINAQPSHWDLAPGGTIELDLNVTRYPGFTEADLPPNMPTSGTSIAKDQTSGVLKLTVPANVPPGIYTFLVQGSGPFPFSKDPNAKQKPNVNVSQPSNPITITVRK
jgi:hypothetical protein